MKPFTLASFFLLVIVAEAGASDFTAASHWERLSATAAGNSFTPEVSFDGRYVFFVGSAKNVTSNGFSGAALNIFRRDLATQQTVLVSVDQAGARGGDGDSAFFSVSSNGVQVAFASSAANLVSNDTNGASDIFIRDLALGVTRIVTVGISGSVTPADPNPSQIQPLSSNPQISSDGRWLAFESRSDQLVTIPDAQNSVDIFARDLISNQTVLVSINLDGTTIPTNGVHRFPHISGDGRYVSFISTATNLVSDVADFGEKIYIRDLQTETTILITRVLEMIVDPDGSPCCRRYRVLDYTLSEDGQVVAFKVTKDYAGTWVFRAGLDDPFPMLLSTNSYWQSGPSLSADGRYLAYEDGSNVMVWDDVVQQATIASLNSSGQPATGVSQSPCLSADGKAIAFLSNSDDFLSGNSSYGSFQLYYRRLDSPDSFPVLASRNTNGAPANESHELQIPVLSRDGSLVVFASSASDLTAGDYNLASDIFAFHAPTRGNGSLELVSRALELKPALTRFFANRVGSRAISADAGTVAYFGYQTNGASDVFVRRLSAETEVTPGSGTNSSFDPEITPDGRYICYTRRTELSGYWRDDVVRSDLLTGSNSVVNTTNAITPAGSTYGHSMTSDGRFVAYGMSTDPYSVATANIYVRDFLLNSNFVASFNPLGTQIIGESPIFAPDDQHLFFVGTSPGTLGKQVYMKTLGGDNRSLLISHYEASPDYSWFTFVRGVVISGNSQTVVFGATTGGDFGLYRNDLSSNAVSQICSPCRNPSVDRSGNLIAYESGDQFVPIHDIYLRDGSSGPARLISDRGRLGFPEGATLNSTFPVISGDGRLVVFMSRLAGHPTNLSRLYLYDRSNDEYTVLTPGPQGLGVPGTAGPMLQFARDDRTLLLQAFAGDLIEGDYNDTRDIFTVRLAAGDSDHDGMDDDWEVAYFGNLARDGSGDFDHDGKSDVEEFRSGTDPTDENSVVRVVAISHGGNGTTIIWNGSPNHSYRVEMKRDLNETAWTSIPGFPQFNGSTAYLRDTTAGPTARRFYRVISLP